MKPLSTLFLDRDGVINTELPADYVKNTEEFLFEPGVFEALKLLQPYFCRTIIVTNQRGVGAGIMSENDLNTVHQFMMKSLNDHEISIDAIYAATDEDRKSHRRKPYPYMGLQAKNDFPDIDFSKSLMIGNSSSDMEFGKALDMVTVFIDDKKKHDGIQLLKNTDIETDSLLLAATLFEEKILPLFDH